MHIFFLSERLDRSIPLGDRWFPTEREKRTGQRAISRWDHDGCEQEPICVWDTTADHEG